MKRILLAGAAALLTGAASAAIPSPGSIAEHQLAGRDVVAVPKTKRPATDVPEPSTLALVALALLGVLRLRP